MKSYRFTKGLKIVKDHFEKISKQYKKITGLNYHYVIGEVERRKVIDPIYQGLPVWMVEDCHTTTIITYQVNYDDRIFSRGYEFVGLIDYTQTPNYVVSLKEGYNLNSKIEEYESFQCFGCNSKRKRNKTFFAEKEGKLVALGSKCISEYTGISPNNFSNIAPFFVELDEWLKDYSGVTEQLYNVDALIRVSAYYIRHYGYVKSGEHESTVSRVKEFFNSKEITEKYKNEVLSGSVDTKSVLEFWENQEGINDFIMNMQTIIGEEKVSERWVGLACYLFEGYRRSQQKESEAKTFRNAHEINEGRQEITIVKIVSERSFETGYGTMHIVSYLTDKNDVVQYKGSCPFYDEFSEPVKIKGTIKHDEYNGKKLNRLSRIKELTQS